MNDTSGSSPRFDRLFDALAGGVVTAGEAVGHISAMHRHKPALNDGSEQVRADLHREARTGMPEVIFSPGKTAAQVRNAAEQLLRNSSSPVIATKASAELFESVSALSHEAEYSEIGRTIVFRRSHDAPIGSITVVTAGTSDVPIAEEAAVTAEACGAKVDRIFDVGVAGLHRIINVADDLRAADVIIVVAGMEGALPSVVGGLVRSPVVAVPTSVGYGASFGGLAALLSMLNSCAPGVAVVNIDNGFGAAAFAVRMLKAFA
ncbi:MAG: nickel pincer cofactor biosynthesis protein LarB [Actinomycetota bacterium]